MKRLEKKVRKGKKKVTRITERITERIKQIPSKTKKLEAIDAKWVPGNKKVEKWVII